MTNPKQILQISGVVCLLSLSGCSALKAAAGSASVIHWDFIVDVVSSYWKEILIGITMLVSVLFKILSDAEKDARIKNRKLAKEHKLHKVKFPKTLTLQKRRTSGKIRDFMPAVKSAVFTVKNNVSHQHGSGFVFAKGWLLTNFHVVGNEEYVILKPMDKDVGFPGRVMAVMEEEDVALIKAPDDAEATPLPVNFSMPKVGDDVYALGTPLQESLEGTLTRGVVSAMRTYGETELIQSDVTIHSGNSGGPLLDKYGNVVGITVSGVKVGEAMANLNNFIPIKEIKHFPVKLTAK